MYLYQAALPPATAAAPPWTGSLHRDHVTRPKLLPVDKFHVQPCKKEGKQIKTETHQP